jgi:NADPH-dependent glutamate synthase beta subunit-like oxidoreductase/ferredoxin
VGTDLGPARPLVWSERTTLEVKTGGWRVRRPQYVERDAPCRAACPAGEPVAAWIAEVLAGRYERAWELIRRENPLPAVTGRVCAHPCEGACNRAGYDGAVAINALEQFVGDWGLAHGRVEAAAPRLSESIAVVGGGPAGLACAYHLARLGYRATIFEAMPALGGLLRYGIPPYRLPREVLDREIEMLLGPAIEVRTETALGRDLPWESLRAWDAVFVATGAPAPLRLGLRNEDARGVEDGLSFLRRANAEGRVATGRRVVVVGGGSTAMDVARTARRGGALSVIVLALEPREAMPALPDEVEQALAEGVEIKNGVGVAGLRAEGGRVTGLVARAASLEREESGRIRPIFFPGADVPLEADTVYVAIGQVPDPALLPPGLRMDGPSVAARADGATDARRTFAGGDLTRLPGSVAQALGAGTRAAIGIDRALRAARAGSRAARGPVSTMSAHLGEGVPAGVERRPGEVVTLGGINLDYFPRLPRAARRERPPATRARSFVPVIEGLTEVEARDEAGRCFSCGRCVHCDNCLHVCPDLAIGRADGGYRVLAEHCKGCGLCAWECPGGALVMVAER